MKDEKDNIRKELKDRFNEALSTHKLNLKDIAISADELCDHVSPFLLNNPHITCQLVGNFPRGSKAYFGTGV